MSSGYKNGQKATTVNPVNSDCAGRRRFCAGRDWQGHNVATKSSWAQDCSHRAARRPITDLQLKWP
ncbi:hypothetical protein A2U01_0094520 [Trifolium medium]|uniref:Uncharacterized protein n=1 Tax=Trifolium medium TaxID=97028 RepID=A0A392ULD2_9FABA|nr:hypothetical protein [Trifolium medium]